MVRRGGGGLKEATNNNCRVLQYIDMHPALEKEVLSIAAFLH